ncbi:hypothetical protein QOZ80_3BG0267500 [Eleusine coracana subsp. coracana]|nr:hypothetical protein QOZ80_3BG0267500 [Eleusine coracana subsp. coracana]
MSSDQARTVLLLYLLILLLSALAQAEEPEAITPPAAEGTCAGPKMPQRPKGAASEADRDPDDPGGQHGGRVPAPLLPLRPDSNLFVVLKAFASGVILGTGYMHVLPDSFNDLTSPCLPRNPWREFPFTTFVAMLAAVLTLLVDSLMLTFYNRRRKGNDSPPPVHAGQYCHGHDAGIVVVETETVPRPDDADNKDQVVDVEASKKKQLLRNRVIVQAEYGARVKSVLVFFFSTTTPFGVALGLALTKVYSDSSPTVLVVVGLLNAASAGLLHYMALVDLLAADFMGPKLQGSVRLQLVSFLAVLLGAGGMSIMAKWA